MSDTNKYHLTLEDAESGMTLAHKKPGYIEVGINGGDVEFSMPVEFLNTFVQSVGGSLMLPAAVGTGRERVRLEPAPNVQKKIQFIKDLRQVVSDVSGQTPGLKESKELVEAAMGGNKPEIFIGSTQHAQAIVRKLRNCGWGCFAESV